MRLDKEGLYYIKLLERQYGQLSEVPEDDESLKKLRELVQKPRIIKKKKRNNGENKTTYIEYYLSPIEKSKFDTIVKKQTRSRSAIVRRVIFNYIDNPKNIDIKDIDYKPKRRYITAVHPNDRAKLDKIVSKLGVYKRDLTTTLVLNYLKEKLNE